MKTGYRFHVLTCNRETLEESERSPHCLQGYSINEIPDAAINAASTYVIDREPIIGIKKKVVVSVPRMLPIVEIP